MFGQLCFLDSDVVHCSLDKRALFSVKVRKKIPHANGKGYSHKWLGEILPGFYAEFVTLDCDELYKNSLDAVRKTVLS
jgi:hypothetical protein